MTKKIYFVCAPIFLHWPVEIVKRINVLNSNNIISGGFIGGAKKYHTLLKEEFGELADEVVYTHDLEKNWLEEKFKEEDLAFFKELFGSGKLFGVEIFGNVTEQTGLYSMGYMDNGLMLLPPSSLILVAIYIWIQKVRNPSLIETN